MRTLLIAIGLMAAAAVHAQAPNAIERQVCRAAIGALFGRVPAIVKVNASVGAELHLSYIRPDDRKLWTYKCKVEGARVMWGSRDGRWRDHPLDEVVEYSVTPAAVSIVAKAGGGSATHKYPRSKFGK